MNARQFTVAILKMANIPTVTAKVRVTGREQSNSVNAYELQRSSAFTYIEKENKLEESYSWKSRDDKSGTRQTPTKDTRLGKTRNSNLLVFSSIV